MLGAKGVALRVVLGPDVHMRAKRVHLVLRWLRPPGMKSVSPGVDYIESPVELGDFKLSLGSMAAAPGWPP